MPTKPEIVVFSSRKSLLDKVASLKKSRLFAFSTSKPDTLKTQLKNFTAPVIVYLDAESFPAKEIERLVAAQRETVKIGVIDSNGAIVDPAALMRVGAVDYIGKKLVQEGIPNKRMQSVIDYCSFALDTAIGRPKSREKWILSGNDWKNVRSGQEYTFCFMFVELDLIDEWKRKSGAAHLDEVRAIFQKHIQQFAEGLSGKIWMWMDLGGLILFPFDGKKCAPILSGIRTVLNRTVISADHYRYNTLISYRIALHIGNTVYKSRGNTSTIVSDAVNFLFHFGHQHAQPGNFYLTEQVTPFIPEGFADCFVPAGEFEDVNISRMRLPAR